jgi:hypothetical protein
MKLSFCTNGVALQTMQTTQIHWSAQFIVLLLRLGWGPQLDIRAVLEYAHNGHVD